MSVCLILNWSHYYSSNLPWPETKKSLLRKLCWISSKTKNSSFFWKQNVCVSQLKWEQLGVHQPHAILWSVVHSFTLYFPQCTLLTPEKEALDAHSSNLIQLLSHHKLLSHPCNASSVLLVCYNQLLCGARPFTQPSIPPCDYLQEIQHQCSSSHVKHLHLLTKYISASLNSLFFPELVNSSTLEKFLPECALDSPSLTKYD